METLERRVERLERENRRLRRGAVVALVVAGAVVVMGQAPRPQVSNEVRTRKLVIVDQAGKVGMLLSVVNGVPGLTLADQNGKLRVVLGLVEGEPSLALFDQDRKRRVFLSVVNGEPSLELCDQDEKPRAVLGLVEGEPSLDLQDQAEEVRASMSLQKDGDLILWLRDQAGNTASLGVLKGAPVVWMGNHKAGMSQASLGVLTAGPSLDLEDAEGYKSTLGAADLVTPGTGTKERRSAASLVLFDKEKNVIWQAPR